MSRRHKSSEGVVESRPLRRITSPRRITFEITDELRARHHRAAEQIIDVLLSNCDGPCDALYVLEKIAEVFRTHHGILAVVDTVTEKLQ